MPTLHTQIEINAPRSLVWEALIRKDEWHWWNTFLFDADATRPMAQGRTLYLHLRRLERDEPTDLSPLVTLVDPRICLRWVAKLPGFQSEHVFELQDAGPHRTLYIHQERCRGLLVGVFLPFTRQDEKQGMQRMAHQLKRYAEYRQYQGWR
jgi:hypothetical protein